MFTIETNSNSFYNQNNGYAVIPVKVDGFWSSSVITLYVNREFRDKIEWVCSFTNGSGGRDTNVCDDFTAYSNYGNAMVALVEFAKTLDHDKLEAGYQNYIETVCKPADEARKQRAIKYQEELDADPAITVDEVLALMQRIKGTNTTVTFKPRVHHNLSNITVSHSHGMYVVSVSPGKFNHYANLRFVKTIASGWFSKNYEMTTV